MSRASDRVLKFGPGPSPVGKLRLSKSGRLQLSVQVHSYRNKKRSSIGQRHLSSQTDLLETTLMVTKRPHAASLPGMSAVDKGDFAVYSKKSYRLTQDGVLRINYQVPAALAKRVVKLKPAKRSRMLQLHWINKKDTDPSVPGYDTQHVGSIRADQLAKGKSASIARSKFVPAKNQKRFLSTGAQQRIASASPQLRKIHSTDSDAWPASSGPEVSWDGKAFYPSPMVVQNNSPYVLGYSVQPMSCVKMSAAPANSDDMPISVPPKGNLYFYDFTPITDSKFQANDKSNMAGIWNGVKKGLVAAAKVGTKSAVRHGQRVNAYSDASFSSFSSSSVTLMVVEVIIAFTVGFFKGFYENSCANKKISQLWSVSTVAETLPYDLDSYPDDVDPATGASVIGSPQTWNYNGTRIINGVVTRVGVGNVPVPSSWTAPPTRQMLQQIGGTTATTWNWNDGVPTTGPNPYSDAGEQQTGQFSNTNEFVQSTNEDEGAIYTSWLGTAVSRFGPYPAGTSGGGIFNRNTQHVAVAEGDEHNPGGVDLTCHFGEWNFTSPWTADGTPASTTSLKQIMVDNAMSITPTRGVGYNVIFSAFDNSGQALYVDGFGPEDAQPGLGPNAVPTAVAAAANDRYTARVSAASLRNLRYADGTPYDGPTPMIFGCGVSAITTVPVGMGNNGSLGSVAEFNKNNYQWQSQPFWVYSTTVNEPIMLDPPTVPQMTLTPGSQVTAQQGTWANATDIRYQWEWCYDAECTDPSTVFPDGITGEKTSTLKMAADVQFGQGLFVRAKVTARSTIDKPVTAYTATVPVDGPPTLLLGPIYCSNGAPTPGGKCTISPRVYGKQPQLTVTWMMSKNKWDGHSPIEDLEMEPVYAGAASSALYLPADGAYVDHILGVKVVAAGQESQWGTVTKTTRNPHPFEPTTGNMMTQLPTIVAGQSNQVAWAVKPTKYQYSTSGVDGVPSQEYKDNNITYWAPGHQAMLKPGTWADPNVNITYRLFTCDNGWFGNVPDGQGGWESMDTCNTNVYDPITNENKMVAAPLTPFHDTAGQKMSIRDTAYVPVPEGGQEAIVYVCGTTPADPEENCFFTGRVAEFDQGTKPRISVEACMYGDTAKMDQWPGVLFSSQTGPGHLNPSYLYDETFNGPFFPYEPNEIDSAEDTELTSSDGMQTVCNSEVYVGPEDVRPDVVVGDPSPPRNRTSTIIPVRGMTTGKPGGSLTYEWVWWDPNTQEEHPTEVPTRVDGSGTGGELLAWFNTLAAAQAADNGYHLRLKVTQGPVISTPADPSTGPAINETEWTFQVSGMYHGEPETTVFTFPKPVQKVERG